ncbi:MAG: hypothetical protein HUK02_09395, partial [Bacteroidaceae bacterium]|nr:hypothetical protein [Bacteroidaceae bacterium]
QDVMMDAPSVNVQNGDYYLYNVGREQYLVGANDWGTRASLGHEAIKVTAMLNNGAYVLSTSSVYNGKSLGSNGYVDGSASNWYLFDKGNGEYNLATIDGTTTKYLIADNTGTLCPTVETLPTNSNSIWKFVTRAEYLNAAVGSASLTNPVEVTAVITNPNFSRNAEKKGWTVSANGGDCKAAGDNANFNLQQWNGTFSASQEISDLPNGAYKVTVQGFYRPGGNDASGAQNLKLTVNDAELPLMYVWEGGKDAQDGAWSAKNTGSGSDKYVPNSQGNVSAIFSASEDNYLNTLPLANVTDGKVKITFAKSVAVGNDWSIVDNVRLYYLGETLATSAEALNNGSSVDAGVWYKYEIGVDGDYAFTAGSALTDVVYTTDGNQNLTTATGNQFTSPLTLTAGTYYFKSASAQTLKVSPANKEYALNAAVLSHADGEYVTELTTFTMTYANASTNDDEAVLGMVDGTAQATFSADGQTVNGTLSAEGKVLKATFEGVTLSLSKAYTLSIPANVFGYKNAAGDVMAANEAVSITLNTGAVANGTYFFYNDASKGFLSRGAAWGTEAVVDKYGVPAVVTMLPTGKYTLKFVDTD